MTFPTPALSGNEEERLQFACDIGEHLARLDASPAAAPETFQQSCDLLQRTMGRLHAASNDWDYLDFRRHLVRLVAECYRTARDRQILTDQAAVAATEAAQP